MNNIPNDQSCPHCGRYANRGVTIDALIVRGNEILLIKRGVEPYKGYWGTPGGYVGWDETIEDAVIREVKEELGLNVVSLKQLSLSSDPKRHPKQCINIPYAVNVEGEPKIGDDAREYKWFSLNALPKPLAFDHEKNIEDYLKSKMN